jgi:branched-subunit amino acid ABC-type transport system permease component
MGIDNNRIFSLAMALALVVVAIAGSISARGRPSIR